MKQKDQERLNKMLSFLPKMEVVSNIRGVKVIYNPKMDDYHVNDENLINTLGVFKTRLEAEDFANAKRKLK